MYLLNKYTCTAAQFAAAVELVNSLVFFCNNCSFPLNKECVEFLNVFLQIIILVVLRNKCMPYYRMLLPMPPLYKWAFPQFSEGGGVNEFQVTGCKGEAPRRDHGHLPIGRCLLLQGEAKL